MTTPQAFNLQALLARVNAVTIANPASVVLSAHRMQAKTATRNIRTVVSVIEESEEIECFAYENGETLTLAQ